MVVVADVVAVFFFFKLDVDEDGDADGLDGAEDVLDVGVFDADVTGIPDFLALFLTLALFFALELFFVLVLVFSCDGVVAAVRAVAAPLADVGLLVCAIRDVAAEVGRASWWSDAASSAAVRPRFFLLELDFA